MDIAKVMENAFDLAKVTENTDLVDFFAFSKRSQGKNLRGRTKTIFVD